MKMKTIREDRAAFDSHVDRRLEPFAGYFDKDAGQIALEKLIDNLMQSCNIAMALLLREEMVGMDVNLKADIGAKIHTLTCVVANVNMLFAYATDADERGELFKPVRRYVRYACIEGLHEANSEEKALKDLCSKAMNLYVPEQWKRIRERA